MNKSMSTILILLSLVLGSNTYADNSVPADNTEKNARDQSGETMLPTDQSSNEKDLAIINKIRNELFNDSGLTTYGKNVKIIVKNDVVHLRGPVNSVAEKQKIAKVAKQTAPRMKIRNHLEVLKQ